MILGFLINCNAGNSFLDHRGRRQMFSHRRTGFSETSLPKGNCVIPLGWLLRLPFFEGR